MLDHFPNLAFLPVESLVIHEWHDDQRTPPLIARLRASGVFRNPPVVAPLGDGTGRYMVLDGANRTTALRMMGFPHALVQVIKPDDPGLSLQNWNHLVWGLSPVEFLSGLRAIPDLELVPTRVGDREPDLWGDCGLVVVQVPGGAAYAICTSSTELVLRVQHLNAIVNSYIDRAQTDRTIQREIEVYRGIHPDLSGLVDFPNLTIEHVLQVAGAGYLLPAGITRFTVSPRALHLNYPLDKLAENRPLEEKNRELQTWIQDRVARKGVRYYAEATFLFDE